MFGLFQNKQKLVVDGIWQAIAECRKRDDLFFKRTAKLIKEGQKIDSTYYLIEYMHLKEHSKSISIDKISSRDMYQALKSIDILAEYNVDNDMATGVIGSYEMGQPKTSIYETGIYDIFIHRLKEGIYDYITIFALGASEYIEAKVNILVKNTPVNSDSATEAKDSKGMAPEQIPAIADSVKINKKANEYEHESGGMTYEQIQALADEAGFGG